MPADRQNPEAAYQNIAINRLALFQFLIRTIMLLFLLVSVLVIALDRITKHLALSYFSNNEGSITLIADWLKLTYTENTGIAFGISLGSQTVLLVVTLLILSALLIYVILSKNRTPSFLVTFGLILGGGIGNLIDRATTGRVIDFIYVDIYQGILFGSRISLWPVFNIADSAITVGACMLLFLYNRIFSSQSLQD